jgi:hypothetical protein
MALDSTNRKKLEFSEFISWQCSISVSTMPNFEILLIYGCPVILHWFALCTGWLSYQSEIQYHHQGYDPYLPTRHEWTICWPCCWLQGSACQGILVTVTWFFQFFWTALPVFRQMFDNVYGNLWVQYGELFAFISWQLVLYTVVSSRSKAGVPYSMCLRMDTDGCFIAWK